MKILCAGGGSGGHVTPVVAVINEVERLSPHNEVLFVCDKAFESQATGFVEKNALTSINVTTITAGKLRRYSHLKWWEHITNVHILFRNLRDIFKVVRGTLQSISIILHLRPDIVFAKGGFVCLPVGIAAKILRVPIVIHDSDTRPGLTSSVLARWASGIATGSPLENYPYRRSISRYVGVPIAKEFRPFSESEKNEAKKSLGMPVDRPLIVATGGGLGAQSINDAVVKAAPGLLDAGISILHVTGKAHIDHVKNVAIKDDRYQIVPFVYKDMATVLGAADIVISRASATFIQELAGMKQAAILVPSRALGDQRKNAEVYRKAQAAVVMTDDTIGRKGELARTIEHLIADPYERNQLATRLHSFARPNAARDVAQLIIDTYNKLSA